MKSQNEEIKNEKNDKDNISICSDNLMSTEYNTFQDKKEKGNIPDLIKNEKDLEKYLEETYKKFIIYNTSFYLFIIFEIIIQIIISKKKLNTEKISHSIFLFLNISIALITIKFSNIYSMTLCECYLCFIVAMDIWLTSINLNLLFYLFEDFLNYYIIRYLVSMNIEYKKFKM
jgi:membrane-associated HD superfamily phosphohydrolase